MKSIKYLILFGGMIINICAGAQSNFCSSPTLLSVTANCSAPVSGTTAGATLSYTGCSGNADDDVWYKFVATGTSHLITVTPSASFDAVIELYSGSCGAFTTISCMDIAPSGVTENIYATGLTSGVTYTLRVYHYGTGSGSNTFTICISDPPAAPANNFCTNAVNLTVNTSCTPTAGTSFGATMSAAGCVGTADDDVWYSFTANNSVQTITVDPSSYMDAVVQLYSGVCGTLSSLYCMDNGGMNFNEVINASGLNFGSVYYIRVYDKRAMTAGAPFTICVTGSPLPTPSNDEPCSAIALPAVTSACSFSNYTTTGATATSSANAPAPFSCTGDSSPFTGGFTSGSHDVWFSITIPASGNIYVTPEPDYGISDGVMALYSGTCSSLTQIACSDDNDYPGTANDLKPYIAATGLTPGTVVFLRYWGTAITSGNFGLCVSSPTNDDCVNALYICDLNGYSASTSAAYTADRPSNMRGNAEEAVTYNYTPGINTGGIFGQGGTWGTGSSAYDVQINNNSWIKFTAAAATATLGVSISDCWDKKGIQMQIFSGTNCANFTPVSNFEESSTGFTITAVGLTVGQTYYLMVDGFAGDVCNYTITAKSGVYFPEITASQPAVCNGSAATLTAPSGASSYAWQPGGQTSQVITVNPITTSTYTCVVGGVCGYTQTLTKTIVVNPLPVVLINSGNPISTCSGQSVILSASGAVTYTWNNGVTGPSISVSPAVNTTYTVTGIDANGCSNTGVNSVTVNSVPVLTAAPAMSPSACGLSTGSLTGASASGNGTLLYSWTNSSNAVVSTTSDLTNQPAGVYNLTVTDGNGCTSLFGPYSITNPGAPAAPTVTANATAVCVGSPIILNASSPASNPTFNWTGPNSSSSTSNLTIAAAALADGGTYAVTVTSSNCTSAPALINITVNPLPLANAINIGSPYCSDSTITLLANGGTSYAWTGPNGFTSSAQNPLITNASTLMTGTYIVTVTDNNNCSATASSNVIVNQTPPAPIASANAANYCEGDSVLLSADPSGASSYSWSGPNGFTSSVQNPILTNALAQQSGTYSVYLVSNGCSSSSANVTVIVNTNPTASATAVDSTVCSGTSISLLSSGGGSYNWTGPSSYTSALQNPVISNSSVSSSGTYIVTVTNTANCSATASINILVNQTPGAPAAFGDTTCVGGILTLTASGNGAVNWYSDAALTNLVLANSSTYSPNLPVNSSAVFYVTSLVNGCSSTAVPVSAVNYNVIASASASPYTGFIPLNVVFANLSSGVDPNDLFSWSINNSTFATSYNAAYSFNDNGNYAVTLIVIDNESGCTDTTVLNIFADGEVTYVIPNVFTPNGDNENDVFSITSHGLKELSISMYDRWGLKLYEFDGINASWDGRTKSGVEVPDGTYYYIFHAVGLNQKVFQEKGAIMIIR